MNMPLIVVQDFMIDFLFIQLAVEDGNLTVDD